MRRQFTGSIHPVQQQEEKAAMKFKTTALCVGATLVSITPALAQQGSTVTIYGTLDQGYEYVNKVRAGEVNNGHASRVSQGKGTSYWGFRGSEDLGGGLKTIFNLESGFSPDTAQLGHSGRLFGRQAYAGLQGDFGRLTFGRQYTMKWWATRMGNVFGTGSHGLTTLDEGISNPRADNEILYVTNNMNGFQAGVAYSFGRDASGSATSSTAVGSYCLGEDATDSKKCRSISAMGSYDHKDWGLATGYERNYGGVATTYGGLTSPDVSDKRFILTGYFKISNARFGLGWIKRNNEGIMNPSFKPNGATEPKSNLIWLTGSVPITNNFSIDGVLAQIKYEHSSDKARVITLRPGYRLSKRTQLYVSADYVKNSGDVNFAATTSSPKVAPKPGGSQLSVIAGMSHGF
jgi:predicted porin